MHLDKAIRTAQREAMNCNHPQWVWVRDNGQHEITDNAAVYHDERIIGYADKSGTWRSTTATKD